MSEIEDDQDFFFAYVTTLVMELYYALDNALLENHPLYKQNIKNCIKTTHRVLQSEIVDKYFGTKKTKGRYGEADETSQISLFENIEMLENYHKKALLLSDYQRGQIQEILNQVKL